MRNLGGSFVHEEFERFARPEGGWAIRSSIAMSMRSFSSWFVHEEILMEQYVSWFVGAWAAGSSMMSLAWNMLTILNNTGKVYDTRGRLMRRINVCAGGSSCS